MDSSTTKIDPLPILPRPLFDNTVYPYENGDKITHMDSSTTKIDPLPILPKPLFDNTVYPYGNGEKKFTIYHRLLLKRIVCGFVSGLVSTLIITLLIIGGVCKLIKNQKMRTYLSYCFSSNSSMCINQMSSERKYLYKSSLLCAMYL
jgi:hypothetical protein